MKNLLLKVETMTSMSQKSAEKESTKLSDQVIIVGSGLAGLMTAYQLSKKGIKSLIISKGPLIQTNTWKAQGGVAAVMSGSDSVEKHIEDTLLAGAGLCSKETVERITSLGPELINELLELGMNFDKDSKGKELLAQEGGHQTRRILHVDDQTGRALHEFLLSLIVNSPFCEFRPDHMVVDSKTSEKGSFELKLIQKNSTKINTLTCSHLVLATGGAGKAFLYTSNWKGATADGLYLAHRLGAKLGNLEFVQFHPTCLFDPRAKNFLISEALRGEGAKLVNSKGERFVLNTHPDGELAPRDIVSQAIELEMKTSGSDCVYLDITHHTEEFLSERFPAIFNKCLELGINISKTPLPVVPAAHYLCGGIKTNSDLCSTSVKNLYAVGECGFTGLHGANRLASNSLLECLATAKECASLIDGEVSCLETLDQETKQQVSTEDKVLITVYWDEARRLMWNHVGIKRTDLRLNLALSKIEFIFDQVMTRNWSCKQDHYLTELKNILFFSKLCIQSALFRKESRGSHQNSDYPNLENKKYNTIIDSNLSFSKEYL